MLCAFVTPYTPPFDVVFNRLAAKVTGGDYCHVEVAFEAVPLRLLRSLRRHIPDSDSVSSELKHIGASLDSVLNSFPPDAPDDHCVTLAFHALNGCPLGCRILSERASDPLYLPYSDEWRVYRLAGAPSVALNANLVWCMSKVGLPYDTMGALTSPWRGPEAHGDAPDPEKWFCSNHALRFLQHMNLCSGLSMWGTTPNRLESALRQYIHPTSALLQEDHGSGGSADLDLDTVHWDLVASVAPYLVRAELRLLHLK